MLKWLCHGSCLFFFILHFQVDCSPSSFTKSCSPKDSTALLQFRRSLSINNSIRAPCKYNNCNDNRFKNSVADNWHEDTDCCSWNGVTCDELTGRVTDLWLDCNHLQGTIPLNSRLYLLSHLQSLDLSCNNFNQSQISNQIGNFKQLEFLSLSDSNFEGQIPDVFGNFSKLEELHLDHNNFGGQLPFSVFNLPQLLVLELQSNQLVGHLPYGISPSSLLKLEQLYLGENMLNGKLPSWLFTLPSLQFLNLSYNNLLGPIDQFKNSSSVLETVLLSNNKIHGTIPSSIFELVNLTDLDISSNNFSGVVDWSTLQGLKYLICLNLSNNRELSLKTSSNISFSLPNLNELYFSFCNISEFPHFLRNQQSLTFLDLRSNLLQGTLPEQLPSLYYFLISNNKLVGQIPSSFCNLSHLQVLDLSNNYFSGEVPHCFANFSFEVLNLRNNKFHGSIGSFVQGDGLVHLDLNGNQFEGNLPRSLLNCSYLEVLDVGNNKINDTFPHWLGALSNLLILVLRSNGFHGTIGLPRIRHPFQQLRILDLSHNALTGVLPKQYFRKLKFLMDAHEDLSPSYIEDDDYYIRCWLVVDVTMKGLDFKMEKINRIFTAIDFSHNQFEGEIPEEAGLLKSLLVLNFSHNNLGGHIPSSLGNLSAIESLDLSSNKLVGEIPWQLTKLTFLEVLNFSNNHLTGQIPRGRQFDTFGIDSYSGNSGLCGPPLLKNCNNSEPPEQSPAIHNEEEEESTSWSDWKIAMMGYGCGLVFGISMAYIAFTTGKPWWFVKIIERQQCKIEQNANQRPRRRRNR